MLGSYDEAIDHYTELLAVNPDALLNVGSRGMLYSRTGQYEKAERDLAAVAKVFPRNFGQFYHLYWTRQVDARARVLRVDGSPAPAQLAVQMLGCIADGGPRHGAGPSRNASRANGPNPFFVKCTVVRCLPHSTVREVWAHPRHRAMMERAGVTDAWRDELLVQVNELTPITGIIVRPDEVV